MDALRASHSSAVLSFSDIPRTTASARGAPAIILKGSLLQIFGGSLADYQGTPRLTLAAGVPAPLSLLAPLSGPSSRLLLSLPSCFVFDRRYGSLVPAVEQSAARARGGRRTATPSGLGVAAPPPVVLLVVLVAPGCARVVSLAPPSSSRCSGRGRRPPLLLLLLLRIRSPCQYGRRSCAPCP